MIVNLVLNTIHVRYHPALLIFAKTEINLIIYSESNHVFSPAARHSSASFPLIIGYVIPHILIKDFSSRIFAGEVPAAKEVDISVSSAIGAQISSFAGDGGAFDPGITAQIDLMLLP